MNVYPVLAGNFIRLNSRRKNQNYNEVKTISVKTDLKKLKFNICLFCCKLLYHFEILCNLGEVVCNAISMFEFTALNLSQVQ